MHTRLGSLATARAESSVQRWEESRNWQRVTKYLAAAKTDLIFFVLIIVFGASAVLLHQRTADFWGEDVFYADAAHSLLHDGFYGVNGNPETTQPPGLPGILAVLFSIFGYSYAASAGAMAVFETLGFLIVYEFLRHRVPNLVAGTICIVLLSSPLYFAWATRMVYPCYPYFFSTMVALLSGEKYDHATTTRSKILWGSVLTIAVAASLLIATGTIALLGALAAVLVVTSLRDRRLARTRLLKYLPVLLVGIAVQGAWMHRKPAPSEWSLPGYPGSYLQQLKLKRGNYPELGMAKWSDIPDRVTTNLKAESDILVQLVLRHGINQTRVAVVAIPVLLIAIGWAYSVWKTGGMELLHWYFAGYEVIYLLWPWSMESRFLLPIAPLACLYVWQSGKALILVSRVKPRVVGLIWLSAALLLTTSAVQSLYAHWTQHESDLTDALLLPAGLIFAGCALWMTYTGLSIFSTEQSSGMERWLKRSPGRRWVDRQRLFRCAGYLFVTALVLIGISVELRMASENLRVTDLLHSEMTGIYEVLAPEVEAGVWLRSHTPADSVIMARHWATVHHYAERKMVWFAPISDPRVLFEGIVRHGIDYIVVVKHREPYYLPDDDTCFERLLEVHPTTFRLILQSANLRIFLVEKSEIHRNLG